MKSANEIYMIHERLNDLSILLEEEELKQLFVEINNDDGHGNMFDIARYMLYHNEFQRAHEILLELSEKLKDRTDIYALLLSSFVMCNKHEEALKYFEKREMYSKSINFNLFKINGSLNNYKEAYTKLIKANFKEVNDTFFLLNHLRLLVKCGKYNKARTVLKLVNKKSNYLRRSEYFNYISNELSRFDFILNDNSQHVDFAFKNAGTLKGLDKIKNDINIRSDKKNFFNHNFFNEHYDLVKEKLKLSTPINFGAVDIHLINFDNDVAILNGMKTKQIQVQTVCNTEKIVKILVTNSYQRSMFKLKR